jgi:hypothetical protein
MKTETLLFIGAAAAAWYFLRPRKAAPTVAIPVAPLVLRPPTVPLVRPIGVAPFIKDGKPACASGYTLQTFAKKFGGPRCIKPSIFIVR